MTSLHDELDQLAPEQRELLEALLQEEGLGKADASSTPIMPRTESVAPLSSAQKRLWLAEERAARAGAKTPNLNVIALRLRGPLDAEALERSFIALIQRHEIIRTAYSVQEGEPVQVPADAVSFSMGTHDLTREEDLAGEEDREASAEAILEEESCKAFDLSLAPLLRATLVRLGEQEHHLIIVHHYLVADGMSEGILLQELAALYEANVSGSGHGLPAASLQYADFAAWQQAMLEGDAFREQTKHWTERLCGARPAQAFLPHGRDDELRPFQGGTLPFALDETTSTALRGLGRRIGATPFMIFAAALQALIAARSGSDDVIIGTTVSSRSRPEAEGMLGFFSNNLPLRTALSGDPSFQALVQRAGETAISAYANQDMPFEELLRELYAEGAIEAGPLFQAVLVLHERPVEESFALPEIHVEAMEIEKGTALFDLHLRIASGAGGFRGSVDYGAHVLDEAEAASLLDDLASLIKAAVADPNLPISTLTSHVERLARPSQPESEDGLAGPPLPGLDEASGPRQVLTQAWSSILKLDDVEIDDNFFDLGGTSLGVVQVIAAVEQSLGIRLNAEEFMWQTLGQLASVCEERLADGPAEKSSGIIGRVFGAFKS